MVNVMHILKNDIFINFSKVKHYIYNTNLKLRDENFRKAFKISNTNNIYS